MALRIPWDKYEVAILIDASVKVLNKEIDRNIAIHNVSEKLRNKAKNAEIEIDSVYRNENGISMQMVTIISLLQNESPSLYNVSKLFYEMVDLYHTDFEKFSNILKEANLKISDITAQYFTFDKLRISNREVNAVFFHKPEEPYGFLSNWYYSPFNIDKIYYTSAEQYIMHQKCLMFGDDNSAAAVLATDYPENHQIIGRQVKSYVNSIWAGSRQIIAVRGLLAKFSQNENLKEYLLETNDAYLVECAHSDKIWTCGLRLNESERFDADKWSGQNILGFSLMEVRRHLHSN